MWWNCIPTKYVIDALEKGWVWGWKKRGWIKSDKKPALNVDLWETLLPLLQTHQVHYHWVKGHRTNSRNKPLRPNGSGRIPKVQRLRK